MCLSSPPCPGGNCLSNSSLIGGDSGDYTCQCRAGFAGDHCEVNINDCESNPCLNSGTCRDEVNSFSCLCVPGFVGELCQVNVDDCLMKPCANGGSCLDKNNDYTCLCQPGYTGKDCSVDIDECANNPCLNDGICIDRVNEVECVCSQGWSGPRCEFNANQLHLNESSYASIKKASELVDDEDESSEGDVNDNIFSSAQLAFIIFGAIALPLIVIVISILVILCKQWNNRDIKLQRDSDEARRQNEQNQKRSGGLNNKCPNPSAAKVIVNTLDRPASMYHLNKCHKSTNEYVYAPHQFNKAATLRPYSKMDNFHKHNNVDLSVKLSSPHHDDAYSHTYEQVHKSSNLISPGIPGQQQRLYQTIMPKKSNLNLYEQTNNYYSQPEYSR